MTVPMGLFSVGVAVAVVGLPPAAPLVHAHNRSATNRKVADALIVTSGRAMLLGGISAATGLVLLLVL